MGSRYVAIWFYDLVTDWFAIRNPELRSQPYVVTVKDHGRMVIIATNQAARRQGIQNRMVLADAKVLFPAIEAYDEIPGLTGKLLNRLAEWCIRFSPFVAIDGEDGLIIDATGCPHLWGGDEPYLKDIINKLNTRGYHVRVGMADTIGTAWGIARYGKRSPVVPAGAHRDALIALPPSSLRIEALLVDRLYKLGLHTIGQFITMPRSALRRRFGQEFLKRLDQALGTAEEIIQPVIPIVPYQERLPCMEPVSTATGIEIALQRLLETLSERLRKESKGMRVAGFKCYRIDGEILQIVIETGRPSVNVQHLFKLFELKIPSLEPGLGIELFVLECPKVEEYIAPQMTAWKSNAGLVHPEISELLDRIAGKFGVAVVHRYLPAEHYWPERSIKLASALNEQPATQWGTHKRRPLQLLPQPELVLVSAPVPDYPPMNFQYKGKFHKIIRADGPERIEQEWWLQQGQHRDYYCVEDEAGQRYWLFRLGHYDAEKTYSWYLHGYFA